MAKVERVLVARGEFWVVECAVRADGTSPAAEVLRLMELGLWEADPNAKSIPSDDQIYDYPRLLNIFQTLATDGVPTNQNSIKHLHHGIWEARFSAQRVTFFDTPGDGSVSPKPRLTDQRLVENPEDEFWWFPMLDRHVRLAHVFGKTSQKTLKTDLDLCLRIREEDLEHDK